MTVVHRPDDARIRERQIKALLDAGHEVVYAAPFSGWNVPPDETMRTIDLPRAQGRQRITAARAAREWMRREAPSCDVVLVHDPELVPALMTLDHPAKVWDVHEDTAAALTMKAWLPTSLRSMTARAVQQLEQQAERKVHLLLAEEAYAERFRQPHPIVPNSTPVPASVSTSDQPRAVYVGHVTRARGGDELIAVAAELIRTNSTLKLEIIGHADSEMTQALTAAQTAGHLTWHGFVSNSVALTIIESSMAGLSLLHDEPNYRHSRPTKILEYMARGVPIVTTPTPPARALVERYECGMVVPFQDPAAVVNALKILESDATLRQSYADAGRRGALADHDWNSDSTRFVQQLQEWATA